MSRYFPKFTQTAAAGLSGTDHGPDCVPLVESLAADDIAEILSDSAKDGIWAGMGHAGFMPVIITSLTLIAANNEVRAFRFTPTAPITIGHLTLVSASGSTWDIGLYDSAGNKLASTGAVAWTTANSPVTKALNTTVTLYPGRAYYIAYTSASSASNQFAFSLTNTMSLFAGGALVIFGIAANAASSGVLPSTLGALTYDNAKGYPAIWMSP